MFHYSNQGEYIDELVAISNFMFLTMLDMTEAQQQIYSSTFMYKHTNGFCQCQTKSQAQCTKSQEHTTTRNEKLTNTSASINLTPQQTNNYNITHLKLYIRRVQNCMIMITINTSYHLLVIKLL